jgi:hypothetical protein
MTTHTAPQIAQASTQQTDTLSDAELTQIQGGAFASSALGDRAPKPTPSNEKSNFQDLSFI